MWEILDTNTTTEFPGTTGIPCVKSDIPFYAGFIAAIIAVGFYGTNFIPVKKFDTGDGMFFQWVLCIAIWLCGLVVQLIRGHPEFYPLALLGGFLWSTGNICVVPIIKTLGLGLGLCIWGMTNLLSGWSTGRFGLFGVTKDPPDNIPLNYVGVALAIVSAFVFTFVKSDLDVATEDTIVTVTTDSETTPLLNQQPSINRSVRGDNATSDASFLDQLSPGAKRILGLVLSVVSGVFYGQMFTPAIYIQDNKAGASQNGLDYVFATFSGILLTSTAYFLIYAMFSRNKPKVYPEVILPGVVSGLMWGIATSGWFVANKVLSEAVAFPIIATVPSVLASLLGVLVFKEIKGKRNISILLVGICLSIGCSVCCGLSKKESSC